MNWALCIYPQAMQDSLFHIKFLHNAWFHLTSVPVQLDPRLSGRIFQLEKYSGNICKYLLQALGAWICDTVHRDNVGGRASFWEVQSLVFLQSIWFFFFFNSILCQNGRMLFTEWALIFMEQKTPKKSYPPEWENWNVVVSKLKYVTSGLKAPLSEGYFHPKKVSDYQNSSHMNFNNLN